LNLAADASKASGVAHILQESLKQAREIGAKAVTVHTGKATTRSAKLAQGQQISIVKACLSSASVDCPLALETPCGKKGDLGMTFESMNTFFRKNFTKEERTKLAITIDSCHIFVAGYNRPSEYIERWVTEGSVRVALLHCNDSKSMYGGCVEGHKPPGMGYIGYAEMERTIQVCTLYGIDMVFE
jgi:endonuclease IV